MTHVSKLQPAQSLTPWQAVARIRAMTGSTFRLPYGSSNVSWELGAAEILLKFQVNRVTKSKRGELIKPVSLVIKSWKRVGGSWHEQPDITASMSSVQGETIQSLDLRTPLDQAERERWERLGAHD